MKKTAVIILTLVALLAITLISPSADESISELPSATDARSLEGYIVSSDGGELTLSEYIGGVPTFVARGDVSELLSLLSDGARVLFDSIALTDTLELPSGSFTFSGALTLTAGSSVTVGERTSLTLSAMSLTFERGSLRIRGGNVYVTDSHVSSTVEAVILDYSASSTLRMVGGSIIGAGERGTIDVRSGGCYISGGNAVSTLGAAIYNDSHVHLSAAPVICGVGVDILTDKPIYLSDGGTPYSSHEPLTVRYDEILSRGSSYEIFYTDSPTSYSKITLLDASGREYALTDISGVGSVYLPYVVRYYGKNGIIAVDECLSGEYSTPPTVAETVGYRLSGWYLDRDGSVGYSPDSAVTSDLSVYAVYSLNAPQFTVSGINTVYDGRGHTLAFDTLTHELDGVYSYVWYRDGVTVSTSPFVTVRDVRDSGCYSCDVTFSYGGSSVTVRADGITVNIARRAISPPTVPEAYYNGRVQYPDLQSGALYTVDEISATDAGVYPIPLTLVDPENYRWDNNDSPHSEAYFKILTADNAWIDELSVYDVYFGAEIKFYALSKFGTPHIYYSLTENGPYLDTPPLTVGDYYAVARVAGSSNYSSLESVPMRFSVLEEYVVSVTVQRPPADTDYRAFEHFNPYGLLITATYAGGRTETVTPERISVSYQRGDAFRYGDSGVILGFGGASVTLPLSVHRAEYDLSSLALGATSYVYDAHFHTLEYTLDDVRGRDGIPLTVTVSGGGVDVGEYTVRLDFNTESLDYETPDSIVEKITVFPVEREILWQNTDFVYNGSLQTPAASYLDVYGVRRFLTVIGGAVDAGDGYFATVLSNTDNYLFSGTDTLFRIRRATYDMSGVYWSDDSFTYDSLEHQVTLLGLPDGVRVVGYTDGSAASAGEYKATAALVWDTKNYESPATPTHIWRIERADYDLSGLRFDSATYVYDGSLHYPAVTGELPMGCDGSVLSYSFSCGVTHVSEGRVTVRVIFATDSNNYNTPDSQTAYVEMLPKPVTVIWSGGDYVYDGTPKLPIATADECDIRVVGEGIDADEYVAVATSLSLDYTVLNATYAFSIKPAENYFTVPLSIENIYLGRSPAPTAVTHYGDVIYRYYLDPECTRTTDIPTAVGRYFVRAEVPASGNYLELVSECVPFEIMEILPVSITASLRTASPRAYSVLTLSDLDCRILNNDGSVTAPDPRYLCIVYESGESLRRADTHVTLEYLGVSLVLELEVDYAVYDTSCVSWQGTVTTYDGTAKCPMLAGLPDGVSVIEYIIDGGVNAGEYTVVARLSYDAENYLEPTVPVGRLVINKLLVDSPTLTPAVYDGTYHAPTSLSPYFTLSSEEYVNAGRYAVTATLIDPSNHTLSDGRVSVDVIFEIFPREISVTVSNGVKYLWEDVRYGGFAADLSGVVPNDDPMIREYTSGDRVLAVCDNPNYRAAVTEGVLHTYSYPSPELCADIFVVFFIIVTLLLVLLIAWLERGRIADFLAVTRCRISTARAAKRSTAASDSASLAGDCALTADRMTWDADNGSTALADPATPVSFGEEMKPHPTYGDDADCGESIREADHDRNECTTRDAISELESTVTAIDTERADELISDSLAKGLVKRGREVVRTSGSERSIINVDTLSHSFSAGDRVDVNILKQKSLVPYDTAYIKVLARGVLDKSLSVYANDFSLAAVKMIALTGGEAVRVATVKEKKETNN